MTEDACFCSHCFSVCFVGWPSHMPAMVVASGWSVVASPEFEKPTGCWIVWYWIVGETGFSRLYCLHLLLVCPCSRRLPTSNPKRPPPKLRRRRRLRRRSMAESVVRVVLSSKHPLRLANCAELCICWRKLGTYLLNRLMYCFYCDDVIGVYAKSAPLYPLEL